MKKYNSSPAIRHTLTRQQRRRNRRLRCLCTAAVLALSLCAVLVVPAFAAADVASAVESTWTATSTQIKTVVEKVVFPALDMVLAIAFFTKLAMAYFDYKKHGQFEWTGPVTLFACLVFTLTAPTYIWGIIGI